MPQAGVFHHHDDWLTVDNVSIYAGSDSHTMARASQIIRSYTDKFSWQFPATPVLFFCDLHADADAFLRSLVAAGAISRHSTDNASLHDLSTIQLTTFGKEADIVIAGDIFDKGPSNLKLLDLLSHLRSLRAKLTILAGNHDLRIWLTLNAVGSGDPRKVDYLATHLDRAQLLVSEVLQRHPFIPREDESSKKSTRGHGKKHASKAGKKQGTKRVFRQLFMSDAEQVDQGSYKGRKAWLAERWDEICATFHEQGITSDGLYHGLSMARELIVDGPYAWLFREMKLLTRAGSFLMAHGGVDDELCAMIARDGLEAINAQFATALAQASPEALTGGPFGNATLTKYRLGDSPLTAKGVRTLHQEGVYAIVHGHDNQVGQQNIAYRQELIHFQCDASLSRCVREVQGLPPMSYAAVIIDPSGHVCALSPDWPQGKAFRPSRVATPRLLDTLLGGRASTKG